MGKRYFSHQERNDLLKAYAASGMSTKEYAKLNSIGYSTLQRWLHNDQSAMDADNTLSTLNALTPAFNRRGADTRHSSVPFMDITQQIDRGLSQEVNEKSDLAAHNDRISTHTTPVIEPFSKQNSPLTRAARVASEKRCHQLDVFLPNGICLILHQTSFDEHIKLIKSLV